MKQILFLIAIMFLISAGCSTSERVAQNTYRANLGTATETDIVNQVPRILDRNGFSIYRQEVTLDGVYIETDWKDRDLFADEVAQGITEARSRIFVRARPRTAQASSLQSANYEVENQVRFEGVDEWDRTVITDEASDYFRTIERSIRTELATGIRRN